MASTPPRHERLTNAVLLNDANQKGLYGIPSCELLVDQLNSQGKRARLAEVVKGVIKLLAGKPMKQFNWGASNRLMLVKTLTGTQKLLKLLPPEEVPKVRSVFLSTRLVILLQILMPSNISLPALLYCSNLR